MEIVVNIPAGRLDVYQDGALARSYPVSVGTAQYATPTGSAGVQRMVWNPTWTPPPDAEWARDERPAAPGPDNPMGRVKMHLFQDYYVHGTPARNERYLGRPASHGCIRMSNADVMELATLVLRADGAPVSDETLQGLIDNPRRTRELHHVRVAHADAAVRGGASQVPLVPRGRAVHVVILEEVHLHAPHRVVRAGGGGALVAGPLGVRRRRPRGIPDHPLDAGRAGGRGVGRRADGDGIGARERPALVHVQPARGDVDDDLHGDLRPRGRGDQYGGQQRGSGAAYREHGGVDP